MPRPRVNAGGGLAAMRYSMRKGKDAGGWFKLYRRLRARNACKTCALGMGGQHGGMVNEQRHFPEVCKKSIQAQAADMQEPIPESFFAEHSIRDLERWTPREMEYAGRLAFPIACAEGDTHFRRISWEEAMTRVADDLRACRPDETFFYASGRSSNEAAFLLQLVARAYGTVNIHNCSSYCHQASGVALARVAGTGTATVRLEDLDHTDLVVVIGANPASNHPRLLIKLVEMRRRGARVIVINPLRELGLVRFRIPSDPRSMLFGSDVADLYLQPHVGSDIYLLQALLRGVIERGGADREFLERHTEGWDAVERSVVGLDGNRLATLCGVDREAIDEVVDALVAAPRGMMLWAMGLTHHQHGVDNVLALCNLAAARGWVGKPGTGLMPLRGHSNVQGVGSVGFTPKLKEAVARRMQESYGFSLSTETGLDTYGSMQAAREGRVRAALMMGGNLWGSNPDLDWAGAALRKIGTTAYLTTKLNPGHVQGRGAYHVVLPVRARDEEAQPTTQESMFNFVRLSDGGAAPPGGEIRGEVETICDLAARILPPGPFPFERMTSHRAIRETIAKVIPGYGELAKIDDTRKEFQIEGRTFHEPRFGGPEGRLRLSVPRDPEFHVGPDEFRLMTLRSEGQFNTVVYEEEDLYRGNRTRDVVMMSQDDAHGLGLSEFDRVTIRTETGELRVSVSFVDIPRGNLAMYFPEANVLVPRKTDPNSGTPAFKSIVARIVR